MKLRSFLFMLVFGLLSFTVSANTPVTDIGDDDVNITQVQSYDVQTVMAVVPNFTAETVAGSEDFNLLVVYNVATPLEANLETSAIIDVGKRSSLFLYNKTKLAIKVKNPDQRSIHYEQSRSTLYSNANIQISSNYSCGAVSSVLYPLLC